MKKTYKRKKIKGKRNTRKIKGGQADEAAAEDFKELGDNIKNFIKYPNLKFEYANYSIRALITLGKLLTQNEELLKPLDGLAEGQYDKIFLNKIIPQLEKNENLNNNKRLRLWLDQLLKILEKKPQDVDESFGQILINDKIPYLITIFANDKKKIDDKIKELEEQDKQEKEKKEKIQAATKVEPNCPICLYPFDETVEPCMLGCGHPFCTGCLKRLKETQHQKSECPLCRAPFQGGSQRFRKNKQKMKRKTKKGKQKSRRRL